MKLCERRNRWSTLAAVLMGLVASVHAYDEDHVQAHLQPFFGLYAGAYQNNTEDVNNILSSKKDDFLPVVPAGGLTLGVAYDRFHAGFSLGYQMVNSNDLTSAERDANAYGYPTVSKIFTSLCSDSAKGCYVFDGGVTPYRAFKDFNYDLIPLEAFAEVTMFKNSAYVNFLMGGSAGAAYMTLVNPTPLYGYQVQDTVRYIEGTGGRNGGDRQSLFLFTGYVGARINIADRLNLQGSVGWRGLFTDEVYSADCDCYLYETAADDYILDQSTGEITSRAAPNIRKYRLDLSGAYVRADLRWTFASQAEKDADRTSMRRQSLDEARVASAYRLR